MWINCGKLGKASFPQVFHRFSTGFPQVFHRFSTGYPQIIHKKSE
jgi:hypothetical protein